MKLTVIPRPLFPDGQVQPAQLIPDGHRVRPPPEPVTGRPLPAFHLPRCLSWVIPDGQLTRNGGGAAESVGASRNGQPALTQADPASIPPFVLPSTAFSNRACSSSVTRIVSILSRFIGIITPMNEIPLHGGISDKTGKTALNMARFIQKPDINAAGLNELDADERRISVNR